MLYICMHVGFACAIRGQSLRGACRERCVGYLLRGQQRTMGVRGEYVDGTAREVGATVAAGADGGKMDG
jgi:hypothetical protein